MIKGVRMLIWFLFSPLLLNGVAIAKESSATKIIERQSRKLSSIATIFLEYSAEYHFEGKLAQSHGVKWGFTPAEEVIHLLKKDREVVGHCTGLTFEVGNMSKYNGPNGSVNLDNFDGTMIDGVLPPDSPCAAQIGGRVPSIRIEDPLQLLLFRFAQDEKLPPIPLEQFSNLQSAKLNSDGSVSIGDIHRFYFSSENGLVERFVRTSARTNDPKGNFQSTVEEFSTVPGFGPFPKKVKVEFAGGDKALRIYLTVHSCTINEELNLSIELPNEVPLFNISTGQVGYWDNGKPYYFADETQSSNWGRKKCREFQERLSSPKGRYWGYTTVAIGVGLLVICFFGARRWIRGL